MDLEAYGRKYSNLSLEELQKIWDTSTESVFDFTAKSIHEDKERMKLKGKAALLPQPLLQILSVSFHSHHANENQSFAVYGKIHAEYLDSGNLILYELYDRDRSEPEILSSNGNLTLIGPNCVSTRPEYACLPLFRSRIKVKLFEGDDNVFAKQSLCLDDEFDVDDNYECVKTKLIRSEFGYLSVKYIAIPLGINCRIQVLFSKDKQVSRKPEFGDVNGKVVVRYGNNYGSCSSEECEECVLFEKQANGSKVVGKMLQLSRCWVVVPALSSLNISVNLFDSESKRQIVNSSVEFMPKQGWMSSSFFVSGDIIIQVRAAWFSPKPMGRCKATSDYHFLSSRPLKEIPGIEIEEKDVEKGISTTEVEMMDNESSDDESDDSSDLDPSRTLRPHRILPLSSAAIEIFSVYIGQEKSKAIQVHGVIEVMSDDRGICTIFKRNENDALILPKDVRSLSIPIPDGSRAFEDFNSLEMKVDIKDVEDHLVVKGFVDWAASVLASSSWHDKQLCSLIQGLNGFAAIYYSIFSEAVGAYMKVFLNFKSEDADFSPLISGSVIAEYSCYDYSSRYNKNNFRNILVRKTRNDPIRLGIDSSIPLSRTMAVVPSYSSLIVNVDLDFEVSNQEFSCAEKIEIEIGEVCKTIETNECFVRIELDWCEIK